MAVVVTFVGCEIFSPYAKLYGKWKNDGGVTFEFKTDDTFSSTSSDGSSVVSGTYKATATNLNMTATKMVVNGDDVTDQYETNLEAGNAIDYSWTVEGTTLTLSYENVEITFTKQ